MNKKKNIPHAQEMLYNVSWAFPCHLSHTKGLEMSSPLPPLSHSFPCRFWVVLGGTWALLVFLGFVGGNDGVDVATLSSYT